MPVLPKDGVRSKRTALNRRAEALGIDVGAERQRYGANPRALSTALKHIINNATPSAQNDLFVTDAPPAGAFDGVNQTFTLSTPVDGLNISVVFTDVSLQTGMPLRRTDQNPPSSGEFYFNINDPATIIVGDAPAVDDMLVAVFKKP